MPVDLHTHSTASDGSDSPADLVAKAAAAGLRAVALTDHDNLTGIREARAAADEHGIDFISGTELSVAWSGDRPMHLLVYFLEPQEGPLQSRFEEIQRGRHDRNLRSIAKLRELGIDISYEEVQERSKAAAVGRPHIAAVLVEKDIVPDIPNAFRRYLARGKPAYQERFRLPCDEAADLARASGAVPVVAHPHTIGVTRADYETAFAEVAAAGVMGIEAHYSEYSPETRHHLTGVARSLGLVATGGSDYHGSLKPGIEIGTGRGDLAVPDQLLDDLEAARATL